jgi:ABC-2 type transport system permease protein
MTAPTPSAAPSTAPVYGLAPAPAPSGGWGAQMARLIRWELFLAWRRRGMVITLSSLLLAGYALVQLFLWLSWANYEQDTDPYRLVTQALSFPWAISVSGQYFNEVGTLLLIVLAGALIGSEYSYGTHRLSLTRGVSRGQLLMAQVIALALLALITSGAALLLGSIVGALGGMGLGSAAALSVAGLGELAGYWLAIALNAFAYSLIALWIGTIGRSVAAAIAGPLVYIFVELVATSLLGFFRVVPHPSPITQLLSAIPDYLLGSNTNAIIQLSGQTPYALTDYNGQIGWAHALIGVAVYCALFITSAYLIFRSRDVRE